MPRNYLTLERRILAYLSHHGASVIPMHICGGRRLQFLPQALETLLDDALIRPDGEGYQLTPRGAEVAVRLPEYHVKRYTVR